MAEPAPESTPQPGAAETTEAGLLDAVLDLTPTAEPDQARDLLSNLIDEAMKGTVTWDKNLTRTINQAIAMVDEAMSTQLAEIMHNADFQKLEGSYRGLKHLVFSSETSKTLKIRLFNASKREVYKDLDKAVEFDQSQLYKKLYENEFGVPGGEPYGALVGDYEFSAHPEDMELLENIAGVCAASFCPFISAASSDMFGLPNGFGDLSKPRDLEKIFMSPEYTKWQSFRESDDSRFVTLAMPRVLSRLPYGQNTKTIDEFDYEEVPLDSSGKSKPVPHDQYTWMNAAYVLGAKLTESFAQYGWCTSIRGAEGGGKVEGLPTHLFTSDDGDMDTKCPTEIAITDRREAELSKLGFMPLSHYKNTDYAVFFGGQTAQKPKVYDDPDASANASISARLPYIMASARIAHFLKVIARDKIGAKMERSDVEDFLKRWIAEYICADEKPSQEMKAKFPLAEAEIEVREIPGSPGAYDAVAWLRPWLFFEELNTSIRMVAKLPTRGS